MTLKELLERLVECAFDARGDPEIYFQIGGESSLEVDEVVEDPPGTFLTDSPRYQVEAIEDDDTGALVAWLGEVEGSNPPQKVPGQLHVNAAALEVFGNVSLRRAKIRARDRAYDAFSFGVPKKLAALIPSDVDYDVYLTTDGDIVYRPRLEDRPLPRAKTAARSDHRHSAVAGEEDIEEVMDVEDVDARLSAQEPPPGPSPSTSEEALKPTDGRGDSRSSARRRFVARRKSDPLAGSGPDEPATAALAAAAVALKSSRCCFRRFGRGSSARSSPARSGPFSTVR